MARDAHRLPRPHRPGRQRVGERRDARTRRLPDADHHRPAQHRPRSGRGERLPPRRDQSPGLGAQPGRGQLRPQAHADRGAGGHRRRVGGRRRRRRGVRRDAVRPAVRRLRARRRGAERSPEGPRGGTRRAHLGRVPVLRRSWVPHRSPHVAGDDQQQPHRRRAASPHPSGGRHGQRPHELDRRPAPPDRRDRRQRLRAGMGEVARDGALLAGGRPGVDERRRPGPRRRGGRPRRGVGRARTIRQGQPTTSSGRSGPAGATCRSAPSSGSPTCWCATRPR